MTATMEHPDYLELESEYEDYHELESEHDLELEYEDYFEAEGAQEDFLGDLISKALGAEVSGPLSDEQETELAHQLLEINDEDELDQFLGNVFKSVTSTVKNFAKSGAGKALGGVLKNVARKALPVVGGTIGTWFAPGVGTAIGSRLGSMAGRLLEMEGELDEQELELEMAKRVIRIGATAAQHASRVAPGSAAPADIARRALIAATRKHAPLVFIRKPSWAPARPRRPQPLSRWMDSVVRRPGGEQEDFLGDLISKALGAEVSGPLTDEQETELAYRLLEIDNEDELDQFIGDWIKKAHKTYTDWKGTTPGKTIVGGVKDILKGALPTVGATVGKLVTPDIDGKPRIGTAIGSGLGMFAKSLFAEMEGELDEQELELEIAKRVIRIGTTAAQDASRVPRGRGSPAEIVRRALIAAVRRHAPAVLTHEMGRVWRAPGASRPTFRVRRPAVTGHGGRRRPPYRRPGYGYLGSDVHLHANGHPEDVGPERTGQWVRRGRTISLHDV